MSTPDTDHTAQDEESTPALADTRHGYKVLAEPLNVDELREFYAQKYFQNEMSTYAHTYDEAEQRYLDNRIAHKARMIASMRGERPGRLLDAGCGEGATMAWFAERGWQVAGIDFSSDGLERHHPELVDKLTLGDLSTELDRLATQGEQFDVIWFNQVLQHLLEPDHILKTCAALLAPDGVVMVEVTNNFSPVQMRALEAGHIDRQFWVVAPDHVSYFNPQGLESLGRSVGLETHRIEGDFPIDWFLFNPDSNYVRDRSRGRNCHRARMELETLMFEVSPEATAELFRALARLDMGRSITAYFGVARPG